jgi:DNA-binding NtrC family response regulator
MLSGVRILVAEDECIIALGLADMFEDAGATVIGPAATVREALSLLAAERVDRAFLDFNLADGEVTPVLELLGSKGVPAVVYTGRGLPEELSHKHPDVTVLRKPLPEDRLITELAAAKGKVLPECDWQGNGPPLCGNDVTRRGNLCPQNPQHILSTI